jgi:antitoxin MazE
MKTHLITIGNSRGIRIPKALLEEANLGDELELSVKNNQLIVSAAKTTREGWFAAFQDMAKNGDDVLLEFPTNDWDNLEWEW